VGSPNEARAFGGSPAFVVDGTVLFETTRTSGAMAWRLYRAPDGLRNVPAMRDLRQAMKRRATPAP